jgi:spermidine/putrescine transport system substrate-binding protein
MQNDKPFDRRAPRKISRRAFHRTLAGAGLGLVTMPLISRVGRADAGQPTVFTWSGYEDEGFFKNYVDKYGQQPNFSFFAQEEEAFAKLRAGFKPDLAMPCSYKIPKWVDAGFLSPIDESRIKYWPDVFDQLKSVPGTVSGGKRWWVCMDWGQTSITYRTDLVDPKYQQEPTWGLLWDERYKGRLAMMSSLIDGVMVAAIYAGAQDPFNMTDAEVEEVRKLMCKQRPLLRYYSDSPSDIQQALASGELVAAVTWNDAYTWLTQDGVPVTYMKPKEGLMTWTCGITLLQSADPAKMDMTYDVINSYLSPEAGAFEIENWGYGHANRKAFEMVDPDVLASMDFKTPEQRLSSGIFQAPIQNEPKLEKMFQEVRAGMC